MVEINVAERKRGKRIKRNEDNLRDLRDNVKHPNIQIIGRSPLPLAWRPDFPGAPREAH